MYIPRTRKRLLVFVVIPHRQANICRMQILGLTVYSGSSSGGIVVFASVKIRLLHRTMFSIYLPTLQKMGANCVFECILAFQTQDGRNVYTFLSRTVCRKNNSQRVTLTFSHVCVCHVYIRIFGTSSQWARPVLPYNYRRMCPKIHVLLVNMLPPMLQWNFVTIQSLAKFVEW